MPTKVPLQVRVDPELLFKLREQARIHDSTISRQVGRFIRQGLAGAES